MGAHKTTIVLVGLAVLAVGVFALLPYALAADPAHGGQGMMGSGQQGMPMMGRGMRQGAPPAGAMGMTQGSMMMRMQAKQTKTLDDLAAILTKAKAAADSGHASQASEQIAKAQKLLAQQHRQSREAMTEQLRAMQAQMEGHMQLMQGMMAQMGQMGQMMNRPDMVHQMQQMREQMQKMSHEMMQNGMMGAPSNGRGMQGGQMMHGGQMSSGRTMGTMMTGGSAVKTVKVVNSRCPILGTKIDPNHVALSLTRMFKGQRVGFCCADCPGKWDKLTDQQKQQKLDAAMLTVAK